MTYQIMSRETWQERAAAEFTRRYKVQPAQAKALAAKLNPDDFPEATPEEAVHIAIRTEAGQL